MSGLWTLLRVLRERQGQERSCRWSRAQLERHQVRSVAELRRVAMERSPFYREFHRGCEQRELHELPILTKATLMERFDDLVTDRAVRLADVEAFLHEGGPSPLFRGRYVVLASSGSTGRRGIFLFDDRMGPGRTAYQPGATGSAHRLSCTMALLGAHRGGTCHAPGAFIAARCGDAAR